MYSTAVAAAPPTPISEIKPVNHSYARRPRIYLATSPTAIAADTTNTNTTTSPSPPSFEDFHLWRILGNWHMMLPYPHYQPASRETGEDGNERVGERPGRRSQATISGNVMGLAAHLMCRFETTAYDGTHVNTRSLS